MKYLFIISAFFVASCTPQERLARLVKNHPELVARDTVWAEVRYIHDSLYVETPIELQADTQAIKELEDSIRYLIANNRPITETLIQYAPGIVKFPTDTFTVENDAYVFKLWFEGKTAKHKILPKEVKISVPVEVNTVTPPAPKEKVGFWRRLWAVLRDFFWYILCFVAGAVAITIIRMGKKLIAP